MDRSAAFANKIRTAFASCSLGNWPTPLEAMPSLARDLGLQALWLKREGLSGGNKIRGLEFLLAGAPPDSVFVTIGGAGSSHCLATARATRAVGHHAAVALFPQPETDASRSVGAAITPAAGRGVRAAGLVTVPSAAGRAWRAAAHFGAGQP